MTIFISPYSRLLRNGKQNPKNYPYWKELISLFEKKHKVIQIGVTGEEVICKNILFDLSLEKLVKEVKAKMDFFISVDNFFPHLCHFYKKNGAVIWSVSNPQLFGYPENINILKSERFLRPNQFEMWEQYNFEKNSFLEAKETYKYINLRLPVLNS